MIEWVAGLVISLLLLIPVISALEDIRREESARDQFEREWREAKREYINSTKKRRKKNV